MKTLKKTMLNLKLVLLNLLAVLLLAVSLLFTSFLLLTGLPITVQASPLPRPLAQPPSISVTHTAVTSHQMTVFGNGQLTNRFYSSPPSIEHNQIDRNRWDSKATTLAIHFAEHNTTAREADVGFLQDFTILSPITLNTPSSYPGYIEDTVAVYASQVLSYQVTQRTLARTGVNCVKMDFLIENQGSQPLTEGRFMFRVDIDVAYQSWGDLGFYKPDLNLIYLTDTANGDINGDVTSYGMGFALIQGTWAGFDIIASYPITRSGIRTQMLSPTNTIAPESSSNLIPLIVAEIPTLNPSDEEYLAFNMCAVNDLTETLVSQALTDTLATEIELDAEKLISANTLYPFQAFSYTISLKNQGNIELNNLVLTDAWPLGTNLVNATTSTGTLTTDSTQITLTLPTLFIDSPPLTVTLTLTPDLPSTLTETILSNRAYFKTDAITGYTNLVTSTLINQPELYLHKQASPLNTVTAGEVISYALVFSNASQFGYATNLTLSDTLPLETSFIPDSTRLTPPHPTATLGDAPTLLENLSLAPGETFTLSYAVQVALPLTPGLVLSNTAQLMADQLANPLSASVSHTVTATPSLTLQKTGPASANIGQTITYQYQVNNTGLSRLHQFVFSDALGLNPSYFSGDSNADGWLDLAETWLFTAAYTLPPTTSPLLTSTATITAYATPNNLAFGEDSHTLSVNYAPAFSLSVQTPPVARLNQPARLTYTLSHSPPSDGSPMALVGLVDAAATLSNTILGDDNANNLLDELEIWQYFGTLTPLLTDSDPFIGSVYGVGRTPASDSVLSPITVYTIPLDYQPQLTLSLTAPLSVAIGEDIAYTFTVQHLPFAGDQSPVSLTALTDSLQTTPLYQQGDTNGDNLLSAGEVWQYTSHYPVPITTATTVTNLATLLTEDADGEPLSPLTATRTTTLNFASALLMTQLGPAEVAVGQVATRTIWLEHHPTLSDGSPINHVNLVDSWGGLIESVLGDTGQDRILTLGERWVYTVSLSTTLAMPPRIFHTVTATGRTVDEALVQTRQTSTLDLRYNPQLRLNIYTQTAQLNQPTLITYALSHHPASDGSVVDSLLIQDALPSTPPTFLSGDDGDGLLQLTETWFYTARYTPTLSNPNPLSGEAFVSGLSRNARTVTTTQTYFIPLRYTPSLSLSKDGPLSTTNFSEALVYTFTLRHNPTSDGSPLMDVSLSDDVAGPPIFIGGDDGNNQLDLAETWVYTAHYTPTPTDTNPLRNTATAQARTLNGSLIQAQAVHTTALLYRPYLSLRFSGAQSNDTLIFIATLKNDATLGTGDPISHITLSDSLGNPITSLSGDSNANAVLETGETWIYMINYLYLPGDPDPLLNTLTATGQDTAGNTLRNQQTAAVDLNFKPALQVSQTGQTVALVGDTVIFYYTVQHKAGQGDDSRFERLVISDTTAALPTLVSGDDGNGWLELGETWLLTTALTITSDDISTYVNTATVTGFDRDNDPHTQTLRHTLEIAGQSGLRLNRFGPAQAQLGETIVYTMSLSNFAADGAYSAVSNLVLSDTTGRPVVRLNPSDTVLDIDETWFYSLTYTLSLSDADPFVSSASVLGRDNINNVVGDTAQHQLDIRYQPAVQISPHSASQIAAVGTTVPLTFTVSNSPALGDGSSLGQVRVVDALAGPVPYLSGDGNANNRLDAGEMWQFATRYTILSDAGRLTSTTTVTALNRDGDQLQASTSYSLESFSRAWYLYLPLVLK